MAQRLDDRTAPPPRAPEPSVPYGDRPTPIVDVSPEIAAAAAASDGRSTARLRPSELASLLQQAQDEADATEAPSLIEPSPITSAAPATAPKSRSVTVPAALGLSALALALVVVYAKTRSPKAAPVTIVQEVAPAVAASVAASPPLPAPAMIAAEVQARAALDRLRTGLESCIRNGIHALPGGSPAVPPGLEALKDGPFTPAPGDWKTAVWSCAQFQTSEPMAFQLQWQLVKPNAEGMGVAWIDQDHDGVADRALGFSITLGPKGAPILGEIREIAATTPVSSARR